MSGDPLRRYTPGMKGIPKAAYNAFVDTANIVRANQLSGGGGPLGYGVSQTVLRVRNDTGGDLERFSVLQLGDPIFEETEDILANPIVFQGVPGTAQSPATFAPFVVTLEPILEDGFGLAVISGVCFARIDPEHASGGYFHPVEGETYGTSDSWGGGTILWAEDAEEDAEQAFAIVNLTSSPSAGTIHGKLTSSLSAGGTATMDRYAVDAAGGLILDEPLEEGMIIVDPSILDDGTTIPEDAEVYGGYDGGVLCLEGYRCDRLEV